MRLEFQVGAPLLPARKPSSLRRLKKAIHFFLSEKMGQIGGLTQADYIEKGLDATETTETDLGAISVPVTGVSRIIAVYGVLEEISTTAEQGVGVFRLAFTTVAGVFKFPCNTFHAPAGTLASPGWMYEPKLIPVNIPVPPKESIEAYMKTFVAATGACRGLVGVIME